MTAEDDGEVARDYVSGEDYMPHPTQGIVPLYEEHPPKTTLPSWRCPDCGSSMPTIYDVWKAYQNKDRLAHRREQHEFETEEWVGYNEGVHHYRRKIDRMMSALPPEVAGWVRNEVNQYDEG